MVYSDVDLRKIRQAFELQIDEQSNLFADVEPREASPTLVQTLDETVNLAIAINTEKARSEMIIIAPILLEIRRQASPNSRSKIPRQCLDTSFTDRRIRLRLANVGRVVPAAIALLPIGVDNANPDCV